MGSGAAGRHAPNHRTTVPSLLFCERGKHSGAGTHRKAGFAVGLTGGQPVRRLNETICARQYRECRAWRRGGLHSVVQAGCRPEPALRLALPRGALLWCRRALLHHARPGGGEFLDRPRTRARLWVFQFSQHRAVSGRDFPPDFPDDFRLDHSGGDHREYPRAAAHQIVWTTIPADASPDCRFDDCILAVPSLLEICVAPLFKREFVRGGAPAVEQGCSLRLSPAQGPIKDPLRTADTTPIRTFDYESIRFFPNPLAWV